MSQEQGIHYLLGKMSEPTEPAHVVYQRAGRRLVKFGHGVVAAETQTRDYLGQLCWVKCDDRDKSLLTEAFIELAKRLGIGPDSPFEEEK